MQKVLKTLQIMAGTNNSEVSPEKVKLLIFDLEGYSEDDILFALKSCRYELNRFPMLSDIVSRMPNGHPDANEAWAMCPKNENDSYCITEQIKEAYSAVRDLQDGEENIQMRLAFMEVYKKILTLAIRNKIKPTWKVTLGYDKSLRDACILKNIENKRLPMTEYKKIENSFDKNIYLELQKKLQSKILKEIE